MNRPVIGITLGDPAGVGPEIIVRAFTHSEIFETCIPLVIGDRAAIEEAMEQVGISLTVRTVSAPDEAKGIAGTIDLLDLGLLTKGGWEYGKVQALCGNAAFRYVEKATHMAMAGEIAAVVTAPLNKEALHLAGHNFPGHTEILATLTNTPDYGMLLCSKTLRVIHATTHVSMRDACDKLTVEREMAVIRLADKAARLLGIKEPSIGVAGLNPHSGEGGLFGDEEIRVISPAIALAKAEGIRADGPVPPDTVFVKAQAGQYDVVVAQYHDQGHIPVKLSGFRMDPETGRFTAVSGVNCTIGLPVIRTSVDHGTAFDRAGKAMANEESLLDAITIALRMANAKE